MATTEACIHTYEVTTGRSTDHLANIDTVQDLLTAFENEQILALAFAQDDPLGKGTMQYLDIKRKQESFLFSAGRFPSEDTLEIELPNGCRFELVVKQVGWADGDDDA